MSKIRKGSIVWDTRNKKFTKVLNSNSELPDSAFRTIGKTKHKSMNGIALCKDKEGYHKYNNEPCYIIHKSVLIPRKEYLEQTPAKIQVYDA